MNAKTNHAICKNNSYEKRYGTCTVLYVFGKCTCVIENSYAKTFDIETAPLPLQPLQPSNNPNKYINQRFAQF